jgi:predicted nucleotide-binding protein (sugar kinase/HSP70/actin superfamily)
MYEAEFRLALRNAGFDGFRVLILEQTGGLNQAVEDAGLELNLDFTLGLLNAFMIADILNDVAYQLRPFEREPGATDRALAASIEKMAAILAERPTYMVDTLGVLQRMPATASVAKLLSRFLDQILGNRIITGMRECRAIFAAIDVDRTRVRPIVKITGEFWAQTTEGDGNFNMFRFLEKEGAQVLVEPIATWLLYMLHQARQENRDRRYLDVPKDLSGFGKFRARMRSGRRTTRKSVALRIAEVVFVREYNRLRAAFSNMPHALTDQYEMQRIAHPYYNTRLEGGEGHLEVAKNIYYTNKNLCHMVLSVKPFGCMPSTQSDGVQSAVISHFKEILYLPIETSGEGEINAHSRVQMVLGEARTKARLEMEQTLAQAGLTMEEFKSMANDGKELSDPFFPLQDQSALIGVSARFCSDIAQLSRRKKVSSAV